MSESVGSYDSLQISSMKPRRLIPNCTVEKSPTFPITISVEAMEISADVRNTDVSKVEV